MNCTAAFHQYTPDGYLVFNIGRGHYLTLSPAEWQAINYSDDLAPEDTPRWVFDLSHAALVAGQRPTQAACVNDAYHMVSGLHAACEQAVGRGRFNG